jgi:hypothetical protein
MTTMTYSGDALGEALETHGESPVSGRINRAMSMRREAQVLEGKSEGLEGGVSDPRRTGVGWSLV